jgi:hypothetical protein
LEALGSDTPPRALSHHSLARILSGDFIDHQEPFRSTFWTRFTLNCKNNVVTPAAIAGVNSQLNGINLSNIVPAAKGYGCNVPLFIKGVSDNLGLVRDRDAPAAKEELLKASAGVTEKMDTGVIPA